MMDRSAIASATPRPPVPIDSSAMSVRALRSLLVPSVAAFLGGCQAMTVLRPVGYVAQQQRDLLVAATILMLLIVIPLFIAIILVAVRYRESNRKATYAPEWEHSTKFELLIWAAPLAIIVALGAMTWIGTHTLDPYHAVDRSNATQVLPPNTAVLKIDVVALDWKWLFLYPAYGIATVNQVAAPTDTPIRFEITASDVMNSFYIPTLAGQIYAMPGMRTRLSAIIDKPGNYLGISANYSGAGFSQMQFRFLAMDKTGFAAWVDKVKSDGGHLDKSAYLTLAKPSIAEPVRYYAQYSPRLFSNIVNRCVEPGQLCKDQLEKINDEGGVPLHGTAATATTGATPMPQAMTLH